MKFSCIFMDTDLLIRIHELSNMSRELGMEKISTDDVKNDLGKLTRYVLGTDFPLKDDVNSNNYTGFLKDDCTFDYYSNGKNIFSLLDESLGVECGILSFKSGSFEEGEYKINYNYIGGVDSDKFVDFSKGSPLGALGKSESNGLKVFDPERICSNYYDDYAYWSFRQREGSGNFVFNDISSGLSLNLIYSGGLENDKSSQLREIYENLPNFNSTLSIKDFFCNKISDDVIERGIGNNGYFLPGTTFNDAFSSYGKQ